MILVHDKTEFSKSGHIMVHMYQTVDSFIKMHADTRLNSLLLIKIYLEVLITLQSPANKV